MTGRLRLAVAVAATIGVGLLAQTITDHASVDAPHRIEAQAGEEVGAGGLTMTVTGVRTAGALDVNGRIVPTDGAFVLVRTRFTSDAEPERPFAALLVDDRGRQYEVTQRTWSYGWVAGPVIAVEGEFVFEVPLDALGELSLVVYPQRPTTGSFGETREIPVSYLSIAITADPPAAGETAAPELPVPVP